VAPGNRVDGITLTQSSEFALAHNLRFAFFVGLLDLLPSMSLSTFKRPRVSAISYLNTAPLMWDFEHDAAGAAFDISYTVPSRCASQLIEGSADIGIIPTAAYAMIPGLAVLPGMAIASRREVRSILLVSRVPLPQIRTVALDNSSLTSVALIKVLFAKFWGGAPAFTSMAPDVEQMLKNHDSALLIGDPALRVDGFRYHTYDLAQEWIRFTGKPFVFAFWAVRQRALAEFSPSLDLATTFQTSRDHGLEARNLDRIAREWSPRLGLTEADVRSYLTENIHYSLDADCVEGLMLFYRYAHEFDLLPRSPELSFLDPAKLAL
jgi:chorismate dehydratase